MKKGLVAPRLEQPVLRSQPGDVNNCRETCSRQYDGVLDFYLHSIAICFFQVSGLKGCQVSGLERCQVSAIMSVISEALTMLLP